MQHTDGIKAPTKIRVATCVPLQQSSATDKTKWLNDALAKTDCDLFLLSQEYYGGHYIEPDHLHYEQAWLDDTVGGLAQKHGKKYAQQILDEAKKVVASTDVTVPSDGANLTELSLTRPKTPSNSASQTQVNG